MYVDKTASARDVAWRCGRTERLSQFVALWVLCFVNWIWSPIVQLFCTYHDTRASCAATVVDWIKFDANLNEKGLKRH